MKDDTLYYKDRKVVKQNESDGILWIYHNDALAGHFGVNKTLQNIRQHYYWPYMDKDIKQYVESCHECQIQGIKKKVLNTTSITPVKPWHRVGIDFIGPLKTTTRGNRYIITAMDYFTRWPEAKALPAATAQTAANFIYEEIICRHGTFDVLHSDQGTHFVNEIIQQLLNKFNTKHHKVTAYHPQANGLIEKFNGTLKRTLAKIAEDKDDWDLYIAPALFAYRSHKITAIGTSSAMMEFGRNMSGVDQIQPGTTIWQRMYHMVTQLPMIHRQALQKWKDQHDETPVPSELKIGQSVLWYRTYLGTDNKAMQPKWDGPYKISQVFDNNTYQLENPEGVKSQPINGKFLKEYRDRNYLEPIVVIEK